MTHIWFNGAVVKRERAHLSVEDRGFRFGDGVFESVSVVEGVLYQWELHESRLLEGLHALRITPPEVDFRGVILKLLKKNELQDGFARIAISRGVGSQGYRPTADITPTVVVEMLPYMPPRRKAMKLWLSSHTKPSRSALPVNYKLAQGINSTLAILEATEHACDEALLLNEQGQICEAASANIFWYQDNILYTPPLDSGCLRGTTRDAVLRISPYPVKHVKAWLETLHDAEAVFLTNCRLGIMPVSGLAPLEWCWHFHAAIMALQDALREDVKRYVKAHRDD